MGVLRTARWGSRLSVVCATVLVLLAASVMAALVAFAHAVAIDTTPRDGAELDQAPAEVSVLFNEPVGLPPDPLRVFDASGARVDQDDAGHGPDQSVLRVRLREDVAASVYTVTWRALSSDGHVVRGSSSFTVGEPGELGAPDVAALTGEASQAGWAALGTGLRWLTYLGTLLAVGVAAFLLVTRDRLEAERPRLVRLVRLGALAAMLATAVAVPVQAVMASGLGSSALVDLDALAATADSVFGTSALVRMAGLAVLLVAVGGLWRGWAQQGVATGALIALLSFLFAGHTVATEPRILVLGSNLTHTTAAAVWFGGLVALLVVLRSPRQDGTCCPAGATGQRSVLGAAQLVARFSLLAAGALLLVTVSGTALAWAEVRSWEALFETTYGWTLLAKITLVAVVVAVAAHNNRRLVPAIRGGSARARHRLSHTVRWEALGIVAVVVVTALLVSLTPARVSIQHNDSPAGPESSHGSQHGGDHAGQPGDSHPGEYPLGADYRLRLGVEPALPGTNEITLHLLDAAGQPADIAQEVELRLSLPEADIAALTRTPERAGPGHYRHVGPELAIAGVWEVEIRVLVSDFERFTTTAQVPIGPPP